MEMIKQLALAGMFTLAGCAPYFVARNEAYDCKRIIKVNTQDNKVNVLFTTSSGMRKEPLDTGECASNVEAKLTEDLCGVDILCRAADGSKAKYVYWLDGNWFTQMLLKEGYANLRQRR